MKHLALLLLICFLGISAIAQEESPENRINRQNQVAPRNPALAFGLSFVLPGAGHMYTHEVGKGMAYYLGTSILYANSYFLPEIVNPQTVEGEATINTISMISFLAGVTLHVIQTIDAPYSARRFNRRNGFQLGRFEVKLRLSPYAYNQY